MIKISDIRTDGGTQSRAAINEETVSDYAEIMQHPETVFPPITVYFDGKSYWLADGFHRVAAWQRVGRDEVPAEIRQGDRRQAILHSCGANAAHGLRRSNDDKRRAVMTLLEDNEWSKWSDREIGRRVRVSHTFVAKVRAGLTGNVASEDEPAPGEPRTYTTKHGTTAQMDTTNIGRANPEPGTVAGAQSSLPVADESGADVAAIRPAEETPAQEPAQAAQTGDTGGGKADAAPDPHAKERRALSGLSRAGLEDEVIGLRAALAEEKAAHRDTKAKLKQARETIKNHTADDKDEVIRRLSGDVKAQQNARFQAEEKFAAEKRKTFALSKRVKELESMGIAL